MAKQFKINALKEFVKISNRHIHIKVVVSSGKDGDYYVFISPTLLVSGYGETIKEARESFEHNMDLFCEDLMKIDILKRNTYLHSLGFEQERYRKKNFTNIYADKNNVLDTLDPASVSSAVLEAAF